MLEMTLHLMLQQSEATLVHQVMFRPPRRRPKPPQRRPNVNDLERFIGSLRPVPNRAPVDRVDDW